ncbi:MAG: hypothetical protein RDU01_00260 [Thermodesulfovibrionales bacterium]|nr:hypothetical protein [Thermodesulfovibrionales bacterium]
MKSIRILVLAMIITAMAAGSLYAEDIKAEGTVSADVMSNYVWRGQKLSNSWVVQPSVGIAYGVFGANIWASYDSDRPEATSGDTGHGEMTETDVTLTYTRSIDKLTLTAGYIYYALDSANDTQELFVSAGYDTLLSPTLTIYYDYDEGQGAFVVVSVGHSFEVIKEMSLDLGASVSYNIKNKVMGYDKNGDDFNNFYNGEITSSMTIPVWKAVTVTPKIAYSFPLSSDAKEAIKNISDDGDKDIFYGGVNLALSF